MRVPKPLGTRFPYKRSNQLSYLGSNFFYDTENFPNFLLSTSPLTLYEISQIILAPGKIKYLFKQEPCFFYFNRINNFLAVDCYIIIGIYLDFSMTFCFSIF